MESYYPRRLSVPEPPPDPEPPVGSPSDDPAPPAPPVERPMTVLVWAALLALPLVTPPTVVLSAAVTSPVWACCTLTFDT